MDSTCYDPHATWNEWYNDRDEYTYVYMTKFVKLRKEILYRWDAYYPF